MPDPERCESGAAGPFVWIEGSLVEVWALGEDRRRLDVVAARAFRSLRAEVAANDQTLADLTDERIRGPRNDEPAELAVALDVSTKPRG